MGIDLCNKYDRKILAVVIVQRLFMAKCYRLPLSIACLVRNIKKPGNEKKIVVCAGAVTDDNQIYQVPAITVAALRFTAAARARVIRAGGEAITFDQLALLSP
uniref:Large ribosomal subunit protein eL18 n=1 Tax=Ditylenchus dipsaci TaxID=166011 RepID=A0A915DPT5_9BILA